MTRRRIVIGLITALATVMACATGGLIAGDDGGSSQCDGGGTLCGSSCVNVSNDNANCGACGNACPSGQVCSASKCGTTCSNNTKICGSTCVDTQTDDTNCGACGTKCTTNQKCVAGKCALQCAQPTSICAPDGGDAGPYCANTSSDNSNCGACGVICGQLTACDAGKCGSTCPQGQTLCEPDAGSPYCANTTTDTANCGGCGVVCNGICANSTCTVTETAVEIFPPTGTLYDPGSSSVWSVRAYTVTFAQSQTISGVEWKANLASSDSIHAEIWNTSQTQLALGSNVTGASTEQFYRSNISYTVQANTAYVIGVYMTNVNTVLPRKDGPSYPFTVSGPHGNITISACSSTVTTTDVFPSSTNSWGPDFKFDIQ